MFHASESLQWLVPWGGQEEDVHHELGGHHEGAVRAETLGHQAWPGRFIWNNGQFDQKNMLCQDFDGNHHLKNLTIEFLEDILCTRTLLPAEHKAASQLLRSRAGLS